jgi:hypothetical protein
MLSHNGCKSDGGRRLPTVDSMGKQQYQKLLKIGYKKVTGSASALVVNALK